MKNLFDHFHSIAAMQPTDPEHDQMLAALKVGAEATLQRIRAVRGDYKLISEQEILQVEEELRSGISEMEARAQHALDVAAVPPPTADSLVDEIV